MKYEDDQPSHYPTDSADKYGDEIDGDVVHKDKVRQEDENHPEDPVDDKPRD